MARIMKKSVKKQKSETKLDSGVGDEGQKTGFTSVILRNAEVTFWSDSPMKPKNPRYKAQYVISIKLEPKHIALLNEAKEGAIMKFLEKHDELADTLEPYDFEDKIWEDNNGDKTLTFRSEDSFLLNTMLDGEPADSDLSIGKGSKINIAINAWAYQAMRTYGVTYYANGINITDLCERKRGMDLRSMLK